MEGYELGKDIQDIKERLARIETQLAHEAKCKSCETVTNIAALVTAAVTDKATARSKSLTFGRTDAGECEWRRQTITIYEDGRYTDVAELHNHSRLPDDGDDHRTTVRVYAGDELIASWTWSRFVPRGDDRDHTESGQNEDLRRNFDRLSSIGRRLSCE